MNSHRSQISARNSAELAERTRATDRLNLDEGTPMPEYVLRNLDPGLWSRFTERANREGWPIKALIVGLLEAYADGVAAPQKAAPKQLPEWAWLREYYNAAARAHGFASLNVDDQWKAIIDFLVNTTAGNYWPIVQKVPTPQRAEILDWLRRTSGARVKHPLSLRAIASIGDSRTAPEDRRVFQYEVLGLPPNQQAWIADMDGWRILRVIDGVQGNWSEGPHFTKESAVEALAAQIGQPDPTVNRSK